MCKPFSGYLSSKSFSVFWSQASFTRSLYPSCTNSNTNEYDARTGFANCCLLDGRNKPKQIIATTSTTAISKRVAAEQVGALDKKTLQNTTVQYSTVQKSYGEKLKEYIQQLERVVAVTTTCFHARHCHAPKAPILHQHKNYVTRRTYIKGPTVLRRPQPTFCRVYANSPSRKH